VVETSLILSFYQYTSSAGSKSETIVQYWIHLPFDFCF